MKKLLAVDCTPKKCINLSLKWGNGQDLIWGSVQLRLLLVPFLQKEGPVGDKSSCPTLVLLLALLKSHAENTRRCDVACSQEYEFCFHQSSLLLQKMMKMTTGLCITCSSAVFALHLDITEIQRLGQSQPRGRGKGLTKAEPGCRSQPQIPEHNLPLGTSGSQLPGALLMRSPALAGRLERGEGGTHPSLPAGSPGSAKAPQNQARVPILPEAKMILALPSKENFAGHTYILLLYLLLQKCFKDHNSVFYGLHRCLYKLEIYEV
ncbi:hypothetical protein AV530_013415 [Patagioenas fasciata monilis]|uniref:Uncharacterized protein n=1 Tax=Patagioenas fasciata monilis TaxID=372326 RepID=A0A1V4JP98_PATFA|nr:hypothetical protein AV530_013415 [Patagioenas fasciata monilis]